MSTTVRALCVSPWKQGSRLWLALPWVASWFRRSASSPQAGSSGCHCRLRQLILAAASDCSRTHSTVFVTVLRKGSDRRPITYFFAVPFPMPRSKKKKEIAGKMSDVCPQTSVNRVMQLVSGHNFRLCLHKCLFVFPSSVRIFI